MFQEAYKWITHGSTYSGDFTENPANLGYKGTHTVSHTNVSHNQQHEQKAGTRRLRRRKSNGLGKTLLKLKYRRMKHTKKQVVALKKTVKQKLKRG